MPTCCAVFISANVGRLVTVVTTVVIEIAFPQNWDTFAVVAGKFRFRIARTIIWNENEELIKNWKIKVILKIEVIRPNMNKKTDKSNIYTPKCSKAPSSCAGEERNVRISGPTQQLLYSKSHDFRGIFALAHSKIDHKAWKVTQLTGGILARISLKKMRK